ncbi:MAG: hypothetical protein HYU36_02345 [Planctomycetes bacterium]|nr:hypothetical protein [Planctomycetota bacterium]
MTCTTAALDALDEDLERPGARGSELVPTRRVLGPQDQDSIGPVVFKNSDLATARCLLQEDRTLGRVRWEKRQPHGFQVRTVLHPVEPVILVVLLLGVVRLGVEVVVVIVDREQQARRLLFDGVVRVRDYAIVIG